MKETLDKLVKKYETPDFIKDDPVQFIHKFKNKNDIEIAGFISSMFAYGNRTAFIGKLKNLFSLMNEKPYEFLESYDINSKLFNNFVYRFVKDIDLKCLLDVLNKLYIKDKSSLEELFQCGNQEVCDYFYKNIRKECSMGYYHLLSNPKNGGAQKRYNMFLRWMIRKGPVDFGIWKFKKPSELLIPLDVHVGNVSRKFGLLKRKSNDFKAVVELTEKLKEFDPDDPVKYDFALFGLGVNS